jgi:hypothetical protein
MSCLRVSLKGLVLIFNGFFKKARGERAVSGGFSPDNSQYFA